MPNWSREIEVGISCNSIDEVTKMPKPKEVAIVAEGEVDWITQWTVV